MTRSVHWIVLVCGRRTPSPFHTYLRGVAGELGRHLYAESGTSGHGETDARERVPGLLLARQAEPVLRHLHRRPAVAGDLGLAQLSLDVSLGRRLGSRHEVVAVGCVSFVGEKKGKKYGLHGAVLLTYVFVCVRVVCVG